MTASVTDLTAAGQAKASAFFGSGQSRELWASRILFYTRCMPRFTFPGWWLLVPACLAQTTTLRPDAAPAEDPQLRAEAVRLMERAVMLTTPVWPANEEFFNFHVLHPAAWEAAEGAMKIGVKTRVNKRWEFTYGTYKYIRVQDGSEFATYRSESAEPAALTSVRKLVPAFHGRFDAADIIRRIAEATVDDRPARCIDFDTLTGDQQQSGQVCVDAQSGFLLSIRQGDETIRQSAPKWSGRPRQIHPLQNAARVTSGRRAGCSRPVGTNNSA